MHNTGDVGAAFAWNSEKFAPDFSISPTKGYISPGMEVPFQITFHPTAVHNDIRYEVRILRAAFAKSRYLDKDTDGISLGRRYQSLFILFYFIPR